MKAKTTGKDYIDELEALLPAKRVERAKEKAEKQIFLIKLSDLRERMGLKQEDISTFTQSGISKLEARKDMKISTLAEYLSGIGMGLEIKAYTKKASKKRSSEIILLKT